MLDIKVEMLAEWDMYLELHMSYEDDAFGMNSEDLDIYFTKLDLYGKPTKTDINDFLARKYGNVTNTVELDYSGQCRLCVFNGMNGTNLPTFFGIGHNH